MSDAIVVDNLSKEFRSPWRRTRVHALRGISLRVAEGETFGFIGPNGAGKSTTIKILMGVMGATGGNAAIFGNSVAEPEARQRVGYVPENPLLYDCLTPLEILLMGLRLHRVNVPDAKAHSLAWLDRLGLAAVATKTLRSFSKGMTQRVAIAQALSIQPRLLVLDEPLSGLDPLGRRDVVDILSDYKTGGGTLFFTSHVLHDVERLADRFGLILEGVLRAVQSPAELAGAEDRVMVRSLGETPVADMVAESGGRWVGEVPRDGLWERLELLRAAGHRLIEVKPTLSLEHAFLQAVTERESRES